MDASVSTGWAVTTEVMVTLFSPLRASVWHPHACVFVLFFHVTFYVHAEGVELIETCREHTHKYCLFLARLRAASVWSLLKSPESDSKMSSIKILAFDLHKSLIIVKMHDVATKTGSLVAEDVFIY